MLFYVAFFTFFILYMKLFEKRNSCRGLFKLFAVRIIKTPFWISIVFSRYILLVIFSPNISTQHHNTRRHLFFGPLTLICSSLTISTHLIRIVIFSIDQKKKTPFPFFCRNKAKIFISLSYFSEWKNEIKQKGGKQHWLRLENVSN